MSWRWMIGIGLGRGIGDLGRLKMSIIGGTVAWERFCLGESGKMELDYTCSRCGEKVGMKHYTLMGHEFCESARTLYWDLCDKCWWEIVEDLEGRK